MSEEILIRVRAKHERDYDGSYSDFSLEQEVVTVEQIISEQKNNLRYQGFMLVDPKKGPISKETSDYLRSHGWIHLETANSREERKVVEQEYYLLDETGKSGHYYDPKFSKINIDDLTDNQLKQLAGSGKIVQTIGPKSVLSAKEYKKLQTKRQQLDDAKLKAKLSAAKKEQNKKAREIAAAKKLLEESGEI